METGSPAFTIEPQRLRVLQALREHGTVSATAEALHLTPSAVSQQLAVLSKNVGVRLLERRGRRVVLTAQAQVLLEHAVVLQADMERAKADLLAFGDGQTGRIAVGAFATAIQSIVAPAMARLRRERPRVEVAVSQMDGNTGFPRLDNGEIDVYVTLDYRGGPSSRDPRYERRHLLLDPLYAIVPREHPLAAHEGSIQLGALAEEPWVAGGLYGPCYEVSLAACAAAGFTPEIRHLIDDWDAVIALVAAGAGVALIPSLAMGSVSRDVAMLPLAPYPPVRSIYAATRAGSGNAPVLCTLVDHLVAVAKECV